jgi:uncharacterized protein HemY
VRKHAYLFVAFLSACTSLNHFHAAKTCENQNWGGVLREENLHDVLGGNKWELLSEMRSNDLGIDYEAIRNVVECNANCVAILC